jgi:uncharacterized protein
MKTLIASAEQAMKEKFAKEGTGHDWQHIDRVRNTAVELARKEGANIELTELAALLHDIDDHKFNGGDHGANERTAADFLRARGADDHVIKSVTAIIGAVSFKGAGVDTPVFSKEAACVQDADRLDAIGAIGIARAFAYGGSKNRLLFDPKRRPVMHADFEAYKKDDGHTINHFFEKLLLLKNRMNTTSGKALAEERHAYMCSFLDQFFREWGVSVSWPEEG